MHLIISFFRTFPVSLCNSCRSAAFSVIFHASAASQQSCGILWHEVVHEVHLSLRVTKSHGKVMEKSWKSHGKVTRSQLKSTHLISVEVAFLV